MTTLSAHEAMAWQASWDHQQEGYMPDREYRLSVLVDVVESTAPTPTPHVLDLAGGTGSISLRLLRRLPAATTTLVDADPVLMAIAAASLDDRTRIVATDLRTPQWSASLAGGFDAVLTATAMHWIPEERLPELYREIHGLLQPGGVFVNADHMPDDGLPSVNEAIGRLEDIRRDALYRTGSAQSWSDWWAYVERDPALSPAMAERRTVFEGLHAAEFAPPVGWHLDALRRAGFAEVGIVWRGGRDAAVAGFRAR